MFSPLSTCSVSRVATIDGSSRCSADGDVSSSAGPFSLVWTIPFSISYTVFTLLSGKSVSASSNSATSGSF